MNMRKQPGSLRCKVLCLMLSLVLILLGIPTPAIALGSEAAVADAERTTPAPSTIAVADPILTDPVAPQEAVETLTAEALASRAADEKTIFELKDMAVDVASLPDFIGAGDALQKGHVNRVRSREENLHTVIYQNQDGTETTYIFAKPVKYVDESGKIKDKSQTLVPLLDTTYAYGVTENSAKLYFPKTSATGVKLQYQDYQIIMTPDGAAAKPTRLDDRQVIYPNVFGANTLLKYQTLLSGVKEDIVLLKNTGRREFDFVLTLTGLTPEEIEGTWYLQNEKKETVASLGSILIKDSAGHTTEGRMTVSPRTDGKYQVKITAPADFLNAEETVYPVYVDPTTTIYEEGSYYDYENGGGWAYYDAITDTGIYTTEYSATLASIYPTVHSVGAYSDGQGSVIYKLYDFYGANGQFRTHQASQIGSATFVIRADTGPEATLTMNPMLDTWDAATMGQDPPTLCLPALQNQCYTAASSTITAGSTSGEKAFDITQIVKAWANYNNGITTGIYANPAYGLMLRNETPNATRTITSVEESASNSVYVVIDTEATFGGNYYLINFHSGIFIKQLLMYNLATYSYYTDSDDIRWWFEYLGNGEFYIHSAVDSDYVFRASGSSLALSPLSTSDVDDTFKWTVTQASGGGYIITNKGTQDVLLSPGITLGDPIPTSSSDYRKSVWATAAQSYYVNLTSFTVSGGNTLVAGDSRTISPKVTPSNATHTAAHWFKWESSDPSVATVDANGRITGITEGTVTITVTHKPTNRVRQCTITVEQVIPDGVYFFENKEVGKYMQVQSANSGVSPNLTNFNGQNNQRWQLTHISEGYYKIVSVSSGYAATAPATSDGNITQTTYTGSLRQLWKIMEVSDGVYQFSPKLNSSHYMVVGNEYNVQIGTAQSGDGDEWMLIKDIDIRCIGIPDDSHSCDHTSTFPVVESNLNNLGFQTYEMYEYMTAETLTSIMASSKVVVTKSHGEKTKIGLNHSEFTISMVNALPIGTLDGLQLVIFVACATGEGGEGADNLVNAMANKGAQVVIGFEGFIYCRESDIWINAFFDALGDGNTTINSAILSAARVVEENWPIEITTDRCYAVGMTDQIFSSD